MASTGLGSTTAPSTAWGEGDLFRPEDLRQALMFLPWAMGDAIERGVGLFVACGTNDDLSGG